MVKDGLFKENLNS